LLSGERLGAQLAAQFCCADLTSDDGTSKRQEPGRVAKCSGHHRRPERYLGRYLRQRQPLQAVAQETRREDLRPARLRRGNRFRESDLLEAVVSSNAATGQWVGRVSTSALVLYACQCLVPDPLRGPGTAFEDICGTCLRSDCEDCSGRKSSPASAVKTVSTITRGCISTTKSGSRSVKRDLKAAAGEIRKLRRSS
jgi:hypothetical protein